MADGAAFDETAAQVLESVHAYEDAALVSGDTDAAAAFFDDDPATSRFGPEGDNSILAAVEALRGRPRRRRPRRSGSTTRCARSGLGRRDSAHSRTRRATIQRTQVWVHRPVGWRIAHAHVSRPAAE